MAIGGLDVVGPNTGEGGSLLHVFLADDTFYVCALVASIGLLVLFLFRCCGLDGINTLPSTQCRWQRDCFPHS